jgi:hypothetical protein
MPLSRSGAEEIAPLPRETIPSKEDISDRSPFMMKRAFVISLPLACALLLGGCCHPRCCPPERPARHYDPTWHLPDNPPDVYFYGDYRYRLHPPPHRRSLAPPAQRHNPPAHLVPPPRRHNPPAHLAPPQPTYSPPPPKADLRRDGERRRKADTPRPSAPPTPAPAPRVREPDRKPPREASSPSAKKTPPEKAERKSSRDHNPWLKRDR